MFLPRHAIIERTMTLPMSAVVGDPRPGQAGKYTLAGVVCPISEQADFTVLEPSSPNLKATGRCRIGPAMFPHASFGIEGAQRKAFNHLAHVRPLEELDKHAAVEFASDLQRTRAFPPRA